MQHMRLERPEPPAERDLLFRRDVLVAENEHVMIQMRAVQAREVVRRQRPVQIEPDHLGTKGLGEGPDLEGLGWTAAWRWRRDRGCKRQNAHSLWLLVNTDDGVGPGDLTPAPRRRR